MTLTRWQKPEIPTAGAWDELSRLRDELDRLFEAPLAGWTRGFNLWAPPVDLYEDDNYVIVRAELPGMKKDQINVSLHDNALTISGERIIAEKRGEAQTHRAERSFGRFQRTVSLPVAVAGDKVKATYKDGILTVNLPKTEEAKPKHIEVSVK